MKLPRVVRFVAMRLRAWPSLLLFFSTEFHAHAEAQVDFNRDIRPILSENCFYCHGQDPKHREADLRLDLREEAARDLGGYAAIVPGKPENSELITRLTSHDPDEVMPPPKANRHVTPEQIEKVKRWIAEGATYQKHWAFNPPQRPQLPEVRNANWSRNPVDRFVLARLETENLSPSAEAKPETWLRRASLDLTGLPPTLREIDEFLADIATRGEPAYAAAVDRLLASPHFGERMAIDWLDAARYADTHGFNNDSARSMWRWRDWVIEAFNANKPYDQFITEQLAGDLLPQATLDQRLATGFCRNHVINSEGGIIEEEYRVEYVADRVRTMSMAWLGLTMECARCHDHKFDPVTQRDYYRLFAFFNNVPEHGEDGRVANAVPMIPAPTREQSEELQRGKDEIAALDALLDQGRARWTLQDNAQEQISAALSKAPALPEKEIAFHLSCDQVTPAQEGISYKGTNPELQEGVVGQAWHSTGTDPLAQVEGKKIKFGELTIALWLRPDAENARDVALLSNQDYSGVPAGSGYGNGQEVRLVDGEIELRSNQRFPAYAVRVFSEGARLTPGAWRHVVVSYSSGKLAAGVRMFVDGREVATRIVTHGPAGNSGAPYLLGADKSSGSAKFRGSLDELRAFQRVLSRQEISALFSREALPYARARVESGAATEQERAWLRDVSLAAVDTQWRDTAEKRGDLWEKHLALRRSLPTAMVMTETPEPRPAFVLVRGQYDAHGEPVEPGVPEQLLAPWPEGAPRDRLGLARWLTQPGHPLTARVVVNRFWAQLFGTGIVKTLEDFGFQAEWPSHPELLDWLAREFVDSGWNVKALLKTVVLSSTYRQDSTVAPQLLARDPENRLLARGPRVRLPAEVIRDQALAISGLLRPRIGGPSVYPYQPEGLYNGVVVGADYPGTKWVQSTGDDLYRRSLYTFWKRTVPHPAMLTFDAPDREFCSVRRSRTNTPLQALTLLNDPTILEASRKLAERMLREGGAADPERVVFVFRLATGRMPDAEETGVLTRTLARLRDDFAGDPEGAKAFLTVGASPRDPELPPAEMAAASAVASMILNLDETITNH